jgi:hypothetical protein
LLPLLVGVFDGTHGYSALTPAEREEESVFNKAENHPRADSTPSFSRVIGNGIVSLRNGVTSKAVEWFIGRPRRWR